MPILRSLFLSLFCVKILFSQYFYTNNKKVFLKPSFQSRSISSAQMFTIENTNETVGINNEIIFKLKNEDDIEAIKQEYSLLDVKPISGSKIYKTKVSRSDIFDTSNRLYEDDRIKFAHPDMDIQIRAKNITSNPLGQYAGFLRALDIEKLWKLAPRQGEGVNVAVIDTAIDINHIDLKDNLIEQHTPESAVAQSPNHGTNCIGIISAVDNSVGSVGIAPKSKFYAVTLSSKLSEVIKSVLWLVPRNVGVLNNSWGTHLYDGLSDALKTLATEGREGNGTIILFASGNANINYDINPAVEDQSELEFVLGVGAIGVLGEKTSYSNYGSKIDLYAFGGDAVTGIVTTSPQNQYTGRFGGTSAASPLLAGVITLMLSINPELRFEEIRSTLQATADTNKNGHKALNAFRALSSVREKASLSPITQSNKRDDNALGTISSIDNITIQQGWNMIGTSVRLEVSKIHAKFDNISVYIHDKTDLLNINYVSEPLFIDAGEGFWIYKQ